MLVQNVCQACRWWLTRGFSHHPSIQAPVILVFLDNTPPHLSNKNNIHSQRMLLEFEPLTARARSLALHSHEKYFYVFFVGTRLDCRGRGLASALIRHHQAQATEANMPIWLEATTAKSRDIYARLGFEVVEEIVLGKGKVGSDGLVVKGKGKEGDLAEEAVGVSVWGMVWRPEGYKRKP
jgi:hypothetical protein